MLDITATPSTTSPLPPRPVGKFLTVERLGYARLGFAMATAALLLAEIALTRVFSGTIGYYFAFMSISVAMLGLGAGSLWVTLRGAQPGSALVRAGRAALGLGLTGMIAMVLYLAYYPAMGAEGWVGQVAYVGLFGVLFVPFLMGGILLSTIFEAYSQQFARWYAIDLIGAALGCIVAVWLLDHVAAPAAMMLIGVFAALAAPFFYLAASQPRKALWSLVAIAVFSTLSVIRLRSSDLLDANVIRNQPLKNLVLNTWNDFSRVVVKKGDFYTWGLSEVYAKKQEQQYDLLIEGVAGTQIQKFDGQNLDALDFFSYDVSSLPHLLKPTGSTLVLGVGAGFDVMMAKYFHKAPVVGVEVNPLVGRIVNEDFGAYSGRPYHLPDVTVHFENARTYVKRDQGTYDIVTVTWVDSGAATGAGAFALTENYLYTVEAFRDYLARLKDDGVLSFLRARYSPESDAIKGIGIAVEALTQLGITNPGEHVVVTSVASPHFGNRELTHVMVKKQPFSPEELATVAATRERLHFGNLYTPAVAGGDPAIRRLITDRDRKAVYASFPFDMEPTTDNRPFYFFLRELENRPASNDVVILRRALITIFILIGAFLTVPLLLLLRRGVGKTKGFGASSLYFSLLGLGFMLIEMKLLQQSVLVVGNPTLSLAAVLSSLLLSTGLGAFFSEKISASPNRRRLSLGVFVGLFAVLLLALFTSESLANFLTGYALPLRTAGLVLTIAPLGFLLGCPLPLGMAALDPKPEGLVAWCWGLNGMFGVAGSAVAIYVAIHYGLQVTFLGGVACYVLALVLYQTKMDPRGHANA